MNYLVYIAAALVLSGLVIIILPLFVKKTGRDSHAALSDVTLNVPEPPVPETAPVQAVQPEPVQVPEPVFLQKPAPVSEPAPAPIPEYRPEKPAPVPEPAPAPIPEYRPEKPAPPVSVKEESPEALIQPAPVFYPERDPQEEPYRLVDIRDLTAPAPDSVPSVPDPEKEGSTSSSFFPLRQHREESLEELIHNAGPEELPEPKEEFFGGDREGVLFLEPEFNGTIHNQDSFSGLRRIGRGDILITENGICFSCGTRIYRFDFHKLEGLNTGNRYIELKLAGQKEGWLIITASPADLIGQLKEKYSAFTENKE